MATKVVNLITVDPSTLSLKDITKRAMLLYVKEKGREDIEWFKATCNANLKEVENTLTEGTRKDIDIAKVRREFCGKYKEFAHLLTKKPKKDKYVSFLDELESL